MNSLLLFILLAISPFQLEEIEVKAERITPLSDSCQTLTYIGHEQIEAMPVMSVADILTFLPSLDIRSRGTGSAQSDVSMHGGTFDQVLVMLNGIPVSDTQTGHYTMNIPLPPALIERIEVLHSVPSHLTGAFSGAINIITREAPQDSYIMQLSAGTNGDTYPLFAGSWARQAWHINASAEYMRSPGYNAPHPQAKEREALHHTDYHLANIYLQTRWHGLDIQACAQYKDAGLGTGYGYASTDQFDATRTLFTSLRYTTPLRARWSLSAEAAYRVNHDRYEWHRGTVTNRHWNHHTQASCFAHYLSPLGRTSLGASMMNEYIRSTNMGTHHRTQAALRAEQRFHFGHWTASLDVAGHYHNRCGWYASGNVRMGYEVLGKGTVYVHGGRSLRMPTWTDMYYKAGVQRGNTDLKAEKAWQITVGGTYEWQLAKAGRIHLSGDVYYRWGKDIIDWTYREADSLFHATNQQQVDALGVELSAGYHLNKWLRELSVSYAYSRLSLDVVQAKSNYLDYLRHKLVLRLHHGIYVWSKGCIGASWSVRWQDRTGSYVDIYGTAGQAFRPIWLMDGNIYIEYAPVCVRVSCTNMTNRHYYDYGGMLQPSAHGQLSLTVKL